MTEKIVIVSVAGGAERFSLRIPAKDTAEASALSGHVVAYVNALRRLKDAQRLKATIPGPPWWTRK